MDGNSISSDCGCEAQHLQLPPGFRFHPTDEELLVHYLKRKAASAPLPVAIIADIDLYKFDPWELPSKAAFGDDEWYFFSPRERKYPNGARPNRAATSGYWKATGTDKPILSSDGLHHEVGVKKALVFYGGKPPKGVKTNWIMHEYRLTPHPHPHLLHHHITANKYPSSSSNKNNSSLRLDNWVLCRIYKKCNTSNMIQSSLQHQRPPLMEKEVSMEEAMLPFISPTTLSMPNNAIGINDDDNLLEYGMLGAGGAPHDHDMDNSESSSRGRGMMNSSLFPAIKRPLASAFWNVDTSAGSSISGSSSSSKRMLFHGDLSNGNGNGNDAIATTVGDDDNTSFVSLLRQLPPPHIHDHDPHNNNHNGLVGSVSNTVLRHQFQLPTLNWNS